MRVAIPVDKDNMETSVCNSFGRAPYFLIYDMETKKNSFLDNSAVTSTSGAGIKAAQLLVDNKVSALLTPRCGENAANVLKTADIKLYKTTTSSTKANIDAFINRELSPLAEIHAGLHGHGGN